MAISSCMKKGGKEGGREGGRGGIGWREGEREGVEGGKGDRYQRKIVVRVLVSAGAY